MENSFIFSDYNCKIVYQQKNSLLRTQRICIRKECAPPYTFCETGIYEIF